MALVWFLLIGGVAGWLSGKLMVGRGFGVPGNILVGVVGSVLGGFVFRILGLSSDGGLLGSLVTSVVGAVLLLIVVGVTRKKRS